ncbi:hypothetical protein TNCV_2914871 [Trichonephila clavipes]|nr:hypothetical protein TNCV_2914871 [Trichonephila clavipes]
MRNCYRNRTYHALYQLLSENKFKEILIKGFINKRKFGNLESLNCSICGEDVILNTLCLLLCPALSNNYIWLVFGSQGTDEVHRTST